jgi:pimeloyl-ACP methyl ester carboxylesterase
LSYEQLQKLVEDKLAALPDYMLLAESFSGPIAIKIASKNPQGLRGVILSATFTSRPVSLPLFSLLEKTVSFIKLIPVASIDFLLCNNHQLAVRVKEIIRHIPADVLKTRLQSVAHVDVSLELAQINVPLLYLHPDNDRCLGDHTLKQFTALRPDMQVCRIEGPHLLLQANPAAVSAHVIQFMHNIKNFSG